MYTETETTKTHLANRVFGKGLMLEELAPGSDIGFDLVMADSGNGKDLVLQSGANNLGQDIHVALLTATGTDIFNVQFGFDGLKSLTENIEPYMVEEFIRLSVVKTLAYDTRIKEVTEVVLEPVDSGERRWTVAVTAQTVLGETVSFSLGEINGNG